jgi:TolA-binding protein
MAKKEIKDAIEMIESPEALQQEFNKVQSAFEKNKSKVFSVIAGVVIVSTQDAEGEKKLFKAVYAFEGDSLSAAAKDLEKISNEFGGNTQNLADLYLGITLLKQGKYDQAIEKLQNFKSSDLLVQARAYSLLGDAYSEKKALTDAIASYQKAADYKPNKYFTPMYLLKLAIAFEANKQNKEALETYTQITDKYPQSSESIPAKKYKAQLESSISE